MVRNNLHGKVGLVTGAAATRGMGHVIALRLGNEGADIAILDNPYLMIFFLTF